MIYASIAVKTAKVVCNSRNVFHLRWFSRRLLSSVCRESEIYDKTLLSENVRRLFEGTKNGARNCLAEGITLVESTHPQRRKEAHALVDLALQHLKNEANNRENLTFRIGLSGPPGAGKSTFIEVLGMLLISIGLRVAVLAIDPSSSTTGGSVLGDKTRMQMLSRNSNAFIRPSPTRGKLGGVARNTNEAIMLCECAKYNIVLVETVGVGQSEYSVSDMVDMFVLLIPPAGGDELQALKRGIVELTDLIVVNKSDGELESAARRIQGEYMSALKFIRPRSKHWKPKVQRVSSLTNSGVDEAWATMLDYWKIMLRSGELLEKRQRQRTSWLWSHLSDSFLEMFKGENPRLQQLMQMYEKRVSEGMISPGHAADILLREFIKFE